MNDARISIVMPCHAMGRFIGEALASVAAQTFADWELIAVDDGGPEDGTVAAMGAFSRQHTSRRIEWIRHERNRGVSAARNTALAAARGRWVAFLDPDDVWLPHHLTLHAQTLGADLALGVSASAARIRSHTPGIPDGRIEFFDERERKLFPYSLALRNGIVLSAAVVSREMLGEALRFDESSELQHVEDYDLWLRLASSGVRFALSPEPTCHYRKHPAAATAQSAMINDRLRALARKHVRTLFEYHWVANVHLGHLVRGHELEIQRLHERASGGPVCGAFRRMRRWLSGA